MRSFSSCCLALLLLGLSAGCARDADPSATSGGPQAVEWPLDGKASALESTRGMVTSGHPLASQVGAAILEQGGNAIDAAVAVGFALAVVLPEAGNIGGGGFLVHRTSAGEVSTLDFRERAPAAASRDMYLDDRGEPTDLSVTGHLAAGVPGSVAGLWEMHQRSGSLEWATLVEPAIELARGHQIDEVRSENLASDAHRLRRFPASAAQFLPDDRVPSAGTEWSQPDLARTLERIRDQGPDGFYRGETAELIVAEMARGNGIITAEDLEAYEPVWRDPVVADYRGHTIYSMPLPSSGGVTLALILNILEGYETLPAPGSAELVHLEAEAMRLAFIERNRHLGDPDFFDLPIERLQSQEYAEQLRSSIDLDRAGTTPPFEPVTESEDTTHYSVVDGDGDAVAITTTINGSFGSAVTVGGAGFLLNNEMDDFAAAPGKPNQYGLVEGEINAVAPGKRMLSSMTPSLVLDPDGELLLVVGSPGGPTIITSVFQVITNVVDHGMSLVAAVEAPRVHHQAWRDSIFFEHGGLSSEVQERLRELGHDLSERQGMSGDVNAILRHGAGWLGVSDPRRGSAPAAPEG